MLTCTKTQIRPTDYLLDNTTILVVDDEPGPRESLKMILSPAHKVITCATGAEALDVLEASSVDVVTIDLNMPAMKGDELMRRIRAEFPQVEIIIITGCGTVRTAVEGLRQGISDYISKPFDVVQVSGAVSEALSRKRCRERMVEFLQGVGQVLGTDQDSRALIADLHLNGELQTKLRSALRDDPLLAPTEPADGSERMLEFLNVLAQALESRDSYLRGHAQRVSASSACVAQRMGLPVEDCEHVRVAGFLHDFGKLALAQTPSEPAQERSTADGLTEANHPELGARLVKPLGFPQQVVDGIAHHHERWEGDGFPTGLAGGDIPLASRIIAVVDAYDLLVTPRPGEPALAPDAAVAELEKQAGHHFDPDVFRTFATLVCDGDLAVEDGSVAGPLHAVAQGV